MKKWILIIGGCIALLAVVGVIAVVTQKPKIGTLVVTANLPDTSDTKLTLNKQPQRLTSLHPSYNLDIGSYDMVVSRAGYQDFSTTFSISAQQTTAVNVVLARTAQPNKPALQATVLSQLTIPGLAVVSTSYFYDDTWAVVGIQSPTTDTAHLVAHYDDAAAKWNIVLKPGTIFDSSDLTGLPSNVSNYLQNNSLVNNEGIGDE